MSVIKKVITNKPGARPVLVDFENAKIQVGTEHTLNSGLYKTKDRTTLVGVSTSNMLYTGTLDDDEELYNNFILVHNREKEICLIQTDHCTVTPRLNKGNSVLNGYLDIPKVSPEKSVSELHKQFGSKKTKRLTEQRERLTMNIDAVKEQLEKTVTDIKIDTTMDASINENDSIYRPKINRNASTRDGVYNLEDLVPEYILDTLAPEAAKIMYHINSEQFGLTPFSVANISNIAKSTASEEVKIRRISIFMYIHYLIKFMNTPMKSVTKRYVVCDTSIDVNNHILETFCVKSQHGRTRPLHMKDKSLCFILVLAAIAMDYEVDVELLSKDMKIGVKKALEMSRILAFNATAHNKNVVTLKLPLPAPVTSNAKRKLR